MNAIHPIAQTDDTVTLRRADFEILLEAVEDAEDILALRGAELCETELGKEAARADSLPVELVMRLMAGEHPIKIWREHRGLSPQALADKAGIARSYLVEIESHTKPGSVSAYRGLATALGISVDDLIPTDAEAEPLRFSKHVVWDQSRAALRVSATAGKHGDPFHVQCFVGSAVFTDHFQTLDPLETGYTKPIGEVYQQHRDGFERAFRRMIDANAYETPETSLTKRVVLTTDNFSRWFS